MKIRNEEPMSQPHDADQKQQVRKKCVLAWSQLHRDMHGEEDLPPLFEKALSMANSTDEEEDILSSIQRIGHISKMGARGFSKLPLLAELVKSCDPGLIFDFARMNIFSRTSADDFLRSAVEKVKSLCPNRERQIEELILTVGRRLLGDEDTLYPLLYGPPGTGKSFLVELLAEAFSSSGISSRALVQPMTQMGHSQTNNEIAMALQGTSPHWSEGHFGMLFSESSKADNELCLTILDEVDKCSLQDYLVTLLDPRQNLQDNFVREFFPKMNMRRKCFFFLTANNTNVLSQGASGALWSRLYPIGMPEYSRQESIELVGELLKMRLKDQDNLSEMDIHEAIFDVINKYKTSSLPGIRTLISEVRRKIFQRRFPFLLGVDAPCSNSFHQKLIGFR